mgnify:CR=1 FL=1
MALHIVINKNGENMVWSVLISQCMINVMSNFNIGEYGRNKLQYLILDADLAPGSGRGEH